MTGFGSSRVANDLSNDALALIPLTPTDLDVSSTLLNQTRVRFLDEKHPLSFPHRLQRDFLVCHVPYILCDRPNFLSTQALRVQRCNNLVSPLMQLRFFEILNMVSTVS